MGERYECPPDHRHGGNLTCYTTHACRCDACRARAAKANRDRYRLKAYGRYEPFKVSSAGTRRRLQALVAVGWSLAAIGERLGVTRQVVQRSLTRERTRVEFAERVAAVYDELWDVRPATSTMSERMSVAKAVKWAERQGFAPPLAWDDDTIDDPAALPQLSGESEKWLERFDEAVVDQAVQGIKHRLAPLESREAIRRLYWRRWSDVRVGKWLGYSTDQVQRIRAELGLRAFDQSELIDAEGEAA